MPPIQWLRDLHSRMLLGAAWMSVSTVAPVVVKPEADSKMAPAKSWMAPVSRKGIVPQAIISVHTSPTRRKPSLRDRPGRSSSS